MFGEKILFTLSALIGLGILILVHEWGTLLGCSET
jgi:regulator of sigma E protease